MGVVPIMGMSFIGIATPSMLAIFVEPIDQLVKRRRLKISPSTIFGIPVSITGGKRVTTISGLWRFQVTKRFQFSSDIIWLMREN